MRILLIAYDFPPTPSPQALRWAYLVAELAEQGHEVEVITADIEGFGYGGLPAIPPAITVHRTYPGRFPAFLSRLRGKHSVGEQYVLGPMPDTLPGSPRIDLTPKPLTTQLRNLLRSDRPLELISNKLNWKGRFVEAARNAIARRTYPDERGAWTPNALPVLDKVLERFRPDVVITSHEPANSIPLGLHAKKKGYFWVADLADPVLAPYTPARWEQHAAALEAQVGAEADLVTVTNDAVVHTLSERVPAMTGKLRVLTQGYTDRAHYRDFDIPSDFFDPGRLELLYTGTFYTFRRANALLDAVAATPGVRLTIATINPTIELIHYAQQHPEQIRLLGFVPHRVSLALQQRADVLVNLANQDPSQVPGKFYEYLGAARPVLHIRNTPDELGARLETAGLGWVCDGSDTAISAMLSDLLTKREVIRDSNTWRGRRGALVRHEWGALAHQLTDEINAVRESAGSAR